MTETKIRVLVVDDEERFLKTLAQRLSLRDFEVTPLTSGVEALALARQQPFDIALIDLKMPGMSGEVLLRTLKDELPQIEVVILTGHGSIGSAVECTQAGSYSYLEKPCETNELMEVLKNAYQRRLQRKLQLEQARIEELAQIAVGESPQAILKKLRALAARKGE